MKRTKFFLICFLSFSCRYIRSERSVILINFCLSIISSNALILIGQTQTRNKVRNHPKTSVSYMIAVMQFAWFLTHRPALSVPVFPCAFRSYAPWLRHFFISSSCPRSAGFWRRRGSRTWQWQAASGIALYASVSCVLAGVGLQSCCPSCRPVFLIPLVLMSIFNFLPGLPALVVAISVGFTKAKGYGTPS